MSEKICQKVNPHWRVHTARFLQEIVSGSGQAIYHRPCQLLGGLLARVGERAAEINDPELNALMCLLTIYTVADPESPDYDFERLQEILKVLDTKNDEVAK